LVALTFAFLFFSFKLMLVNLELVYMYINSWAFLETNIFHTLLCTNWYEFQFCSHDDAHTTCPKIHHANTPSIMATHAPSQIGPTIHVVSMGIPLCFWIQKMVMGPNF
jgi:hypothetical protein